MSNLGAADVLQQQIEEGRAALLAGAADLPDAVAPLWRDCLKALDGAIKAIEPRSSKAGRLWARTDLTLAARKQQSDELVRGLAADVRARLDTADRCLGQIAHTLQAGVMPQRPAGVSEAAILDRKQDIAELLKRESGWGGVLDRVTELMGEAIALQDDLTAYVLTPAQDGPLAWVYRGLGVDRMQLRAAIYRAIRRVHSEPVPGEGLLQRYEAPHTDPLSWQALRSAVEGLVGILGALTAAAYRRACQYTPPDESVSPPAPMGTVRGSAVPAGLVASMPMNAVAPMGAKE